MTIRLSRGSKSSAATAPIGVGTRGNIRTLIRSVLGTFSEVRDPAVLNVRPRRIDIIRLPNAMTIEEFYSRYPTPLEVDEVARINRRSRGEVIPAGTLLKHVGGGR